MRSANLRSPSSALARSLAAPTRSALSRSTAHPGVASILPGSATLRASRATPAASVRLLSTSRLARAGNNGGGGGGWNGMGFPPFGGMPGQGPGGQGGGESVLEEFTTDLTKLASEGKLDPVIGRDTEIRRTLQVLSRRTKSNPVLLGPAGVGKTAIMEGLAQRIINREVPDSLLGKKILSLDLAGLMSGTAVRGQFEARIKSLLSEIEKLEGQVILFIDEMHMLFNLGKSEGSLDASNMMKPLLARGVLNVAGATTFDEYRNTIEKDSALARRFQPVSVFEPSLPSTISILRGLRTRYETFHGIGIADSALVTAARYAERYISERKNPDAALDLIDEAAAALRLQQESKPETIENLEREVLTMQIELESLRMEKDAASASRRETLEEHLASKQAELDQISDRWQSERRRLENVREIKERLEDAKADLERQMREGNLQRVAELQYAVIPDLEKQLPTEEEEAAEARKAEEAEASGDEEGSTLLHDRVTSEDIAAVVARLTGVPLRSLLRGERERLLHLEDVMRRSIVGQDQALKSLAQAIRLSRAGLHQPGRPLASALMLGPTGTGKTETCKVLAQQLFDSQDALIRIDCSELSENHAISKLIGAPPGYVGYDAGGALTEQVRRRPYAIVLFDEFEKAARNVQMSLLQLLDEGHLTDSQGRKVDFSNTIIAMTSNIGVEAYQGWGSTNSDGSLTSSGRKTLDTELQKALPLELLNRIDATLVYNALRPQALEGIVKIRLDQVHRRLADERRIKLQVTEDVQQWLAQNGYSEVFGARPLNRLIQASLLNKVANLIIEGDVIDGDTVQVELNQDWKAGDDEYNALFVHSIASEPKPQPKSSRPAPSADGERKNKDGDDEGEVLEGRLIRHD